jgi:hypothetical protein
MRNSLIFNQLLRLSDLLGYGRTDRMGWRGGPVEPPVDPADEGRRPSGRRPEEARPQTEPVEIDDRD